MGVDFLDFWLRLFDFLLIYLSDRLYRFYDYSLRLIYIYF